MWLWKAKHFLFDALRIIGIRDRLRCPYCSAIGTWKPHGGWFDKEDTRKVRRWMCKFCGNYEDLNGRRLVMPDPDCWKFNPDAKAGALIPSMVLKQYYESKDMEVWPWRG